jgi:hypothetical protein
MAGPDPAIHVLLRLSEKKKDVDARDKPGHDDFIYTATSIATPTTISAMPDNSRADSGCLNE